MPFYAGGSGGDVDYGGLGVASARNSFGQYATGPGVEWQGLDVMGGRVEDWIDGIYAKVVAGCESLKDEMVDYMKTNAPWDDRTTDAREYLQGEVVADGRSVVIHIGHGPQIFYGYFLENRIYNGVSYAIVMPTIRAYADTALAKVLA